MYLNQSCNIMPDSYYENISLTDSEVMLVNKA